MIGTAVVMVVVAVRKGVVMRCQNMFTPGGITP